MDRLKAAGRTLAEARKYRKAHERYDRIITRGHQEALAAANEALVGYVKAGDESRTSLSSSI